MKCRVRVYSHGGWQAPQTFQTTAAAMKYAKQKLRSQDFKFRGTVKGTPVLQLALVCSDKRGNVNIGRCKKINGRVICKTHYGLLRPERSAR